MSRYYDLISVGKLLALKTAPKDKSAIIDEYGEISAARYAFAPTEKRYEQLREEIKSWYVDSPGIEPYLEKGKRFQLDVSACANVRVINIKAAHKKLGLAKFLKACSLTLKALGTFLSEPEIDELVSTEQVGARSYVTTPLGHASDGASGHAPGESASRPNALPDAA